MKKDEKEFDGYSDFLSRHLWWWVGFILVVMILVTLIVTKCHASELKFEFGTGQSRYGLMPDGTWYQSRFPHEIDLTSQFYSLGISGEVNSWSRFRVAYVNFGATKAIAHTVADDNNYDPSSPTGCRGSCLPLATLVQYGNAYGIEATWQPDLFKIGYLKFTGELGPIYYYSKWIVQAQNDCAGWTAEMVCTSFNSCTQDKMRGWHWTGKIGLGIQYKNMGIFYSTYPGFTEKQQEPGIHKGINVVELRVGF